MGRGRGCEGAKRIEAHGFPDLIWIRFATAFLPLNGSYISCLRPWEIMYYVWSSMSNQIPPPRPSRCIIQRVRVVQPIMCPIHLPLILDPGDPRRDNPPDVKRNTISPVKRIRGVLVVIFYDIQIFHRSTTDRSFPPLFFFFRFSSSFFLSFFLLLLFFFFLFLLPFPFLPRAREALTRAVSCRRVPWKFSGRLKGRYFL